MIDIHHLPPRRKAFRFGKGGYYAGDDFKNKRIKNTLSILLGYMTPRGAKLAARGLNASSMGGPMGSMSSNSQSAGGMSIHTLLTSPLSQSLFQKAVIQSGGDGHLMMNSLAKAQQAGETFAANRGIAADAPQAIEKLRQLPADKIMGDLNMNTLFQKPSAKPDFTMPMVDGKVAVDAMDAYRKGHFTHVPVMVGATSDDLFGANGAMVQGAKSIADLLASKGVPLYRYRFSYVAESEQAANPKGAKHASDIPFFFATLDQRFGTRATLRDQALSTLASDYLVNFVKSGTPASRGAAQWPAYQPGQPFTLDFTGHGKASVFRDDGSGQ